MMRLSKPLFMSSIQSLFTVWVLLLLFKPMLLLLPAAVDAATMIQTNKLSPELQAWRDDSGKFITVSSNNFDDDTAALDDLSIFVKDLGDPNAAAPDTILLMHGYPESSYSYHKVVDGLLTVFDRVVLYDMIGFGQSDKPLKKYDYTLVTHADTALQVWEALGVTGGHLLSHGFSVSVATELVARDQDGELPSFFLNGIQSLMFTNGALFIEKANVNQFQQLLAGPFGIILSQFTTKALFVEQFGQAHGNDSLSDQDFDLLRENLILQDGHRKQYLTSSYQNGRREIQDSRWLPALAATSLPVHLCWGEDDMAPVVEIAQCVKNDVVPSATLEIIENAGHTYQLGSPDEWLECVLRPYVA